MSKSLTDRELERYSRNILVKEVGLDGQKRIKNARVLVIGCGGLGCPALQYLVAAGVGTVGIVDFDRVEESNLQRQILFGTEDIGLNKAEAAKRRLESLNPLVNIKTHSVKLDQHNALELLAQYDIALDGTDNFTSRYIINDASVITETPVVYGAIHRFEGQVSVFNYEGGPSFRCLFPDPPVESKIPNCSEQGVLGVLPGIIGSYQANEVMKIILQTGEILSGKLMLIDLRTNQSSLISIPRTKAVEEVKRTKDSFQNRDYDFSCGTENSVDSTSEISVEELQSLMDQGDRIQFIDVRANSEGPSPRELIGLRIAHDEIQQVIDQIDRTKTVVIYCQSGVRSLIAASQLLEIHDFADILSLRGGVNAWLAKVEASENGNIELELL